MRGQGAWDQPVCRPSERFGYVHSTSVSVEVRDMITTSVHTTHTPAHTSLAPRPNFTATNGLHHCYTKSGSGKMPNQSRSEQ